MRSLAQARSKQQPSQFEKDWAALGQALAHVTKDVGRLGEGLLAFEQALSTALIAYAGRGRSVREQVESAGKQGEAQLLTAVEVTQMLSIGKTKLWQLTKDGQMPGPIKLGRSARWRKADIDQFIDGLSSRR